MIDAVTDDAVGSLDASRSDKRDPFWEKLRPTEESKKWEAGVHDVEIEVKRSERGGYCYEVHFMQIMPWAATRAGIRDPILSLPYSFSEHEAEQVFHEGCRLLSEFDPLGDTAETAIAVRKELEIYVNEMTNKSSLKREGTQRSRQMLEALADQKPRRSEPETRDGLPVLDAWELFALGNVDTAPKDERGLVEVDFRGYVKKTNQHGEQFEYNDVMLTNGLLKQRDRQGISVGTYGFAGGEPFLAGMMRSPEELEEYNIVVVIPGEIQRRHHLVCGDRVQETEDEFRATRFKGESKEVVEEALQSFQDRGHPMSIRLTLDLKNDPKARQKARLIHEAAVAHILRGGSLMELRELISFVEDQLAESPPLPAMR